MLRGGGAMADFIRDLCAHLPQIWRVAGHATQSLNGLIQIGRLCCPLENSDWFVILQQKPERSQFKTRPLRDG